jgi:predicted PurR-regulated permease PerM
MKLSGRTVIPLAAAIVLVYFLFQIHEILLPFVLAGALAYLLNPVVRFFEVRGLRRPPVIVLLYLSLVTVFALAFYKIAWVAAAEAEEAARNMPVYAQKGGELFSRLRGHVNPALFDYVAEHGRAWPQDIINRMPSFALGVFPFLEVVFLVPFIGFFFVREGPHWRNAVVGWVPSRYVEMTLNMLFELDNSLGRYLRGILLEAFCVGVLAFLGFWAIGLGYSLQIAVVVGLANVVPYVGPIVGFVLGGGVALFQWGSLAGILKVMAVCVGVRFLEDWFIQPAVMQRAVHLHPVLVVLALMSGAELFGLWGLLFAVPVACMVKVFLEVLTPWYRSQYGFVSPPPLPEVNRIPLI